LTTLLRAVIDATGLSRRKAFTAIREGRIRAGGATLCEPSSEYDGSRLSFDGVAIEEPSAEKTYLLLNKPPGYVTTASDERGRATVFDLIPPPQRASGLHAVGRLDLDTSGLLILTNDGDLTYHLTHPSNEVDKEYWVGLFEPPSDDILNRVWQGIELDGELRQPWRWSGCAARSRFTSQSASVKGGSVRCGGCSRSPARGYDTSSASAKASFPSAICLRGRRGH
jgi:23S rRNA pseudouridine2605 synthase